MRRALSFLLLATASLACEPAPTCPPAAASSSSAAAVEQPQRDPTLTFSIEGSKVRSMRKSELVAQVGTVEFTQHDPYYDQKKTFLALPLRKVLERGFAGRNLVLEEQHFVLRATDGYTVTFDGKRLTEEGGHIALDDLDVADGWQPIGSKQVDPGPFYVVWSKDGQQRLDDYPRPWQLSAIEVARFEESFPKVVPTGADDAAQRGFATFRQRCLRCHAINQQGGQVGPELNVPQSIVEYRDPDQLKAYIRDPRSFRYGSLMPAHPDLSDEALEDLLAYFRAMSERKQMSAEPRGGH